MRHAKPRTRVYCRVETTTSDKRCGTVPMMSTEFTTLRQIHMSGRAFIILTVDDDDNGEFCEAISNLALERP